jgi:hypothetical protein
MNKLKKHSLNNTEKRIHKWKYYYDSSIFLEGRLGLDPPQSLIR